MQHLTSSISKAAVLVLSGLLILGLTGCDFSGLNQAVDDFGVVIELDSIHTSSTVLVHDAKSNKLITKEVEVTFGGPEGGQVIDIYSDPLTERTIKSGILNFGISNSVKPTDESPAEVTLQFAADGYLSANRTVTIENEGSSKFSVEMIRKSDPPSGVEMESNTDGQADRDGAVQQAYTVEVTSDPPSSSSATTQSSDVEYGFEMEITEGTVLKDREGNPLTGRLTTDVTYYNPTDVEAMRSIPMDMKTVDGSRVLTYGMVGMEITDEKGKVAASVSSGSAKVTMKNGPSMPEVQGYLSNAQVCVDEDFNDQCSEAEAMTPTRDNNGEFKLTNLDNKFENAPKLVHEIPNPDPNDNSPSAQPHHKLRGPDVSAPINPVTPLTTLVQEEVEQQAQKNPSKDFADLVYAAKQKVEGELEISTSDGVDVVGDFEKEWRMEAEIELNTSGYNLKNSYHIRWAGEEAKKQAKTLNSLPRGEVTYTIDFPQMNEKVKGTHDFTEDGKLEITVPESRIPGDFHSDATVEVKLSCENSSEKVAVTNIPGASVLYKIAEAEDNDWSTAFNMEWHYDEENQELTGGSFDAFLFENQDYTFKITYESTTYTRDITIEGEHTTYTETVSGSVCS